MSANSHADRLGVLLGVDRRACVFGFAVVSGKLAVNPERNFVKLSQDLCGKAGGCVGSGGCVDMTRQRGFERLLERVVMIRQAVNVVVVD